MKRNGRVVMCGFQMRSVLTHSSDTHGQICRKKGGLRKIKFQIRVWFFQKGHGATIAREENKRGVLRWYR